jgi:hypothetical protein
MSTRHLGFACLVVAATTGLASGGARITWYVDDDNCPGPGSGTLGDPFCSIQDAILAAAKGDQVLVAPGTYVETIDNLGLEIAVRSSHGPDVTILDGGGAGPVVQFYATTGPHTVFEGFTVTGGSAFTGAGMWNSGAEITVADCVFTNNHTLTDGAGGAMFNTSASTVTVVGCDFVGNSANVGAGIYSEVVSNLDVSGCTFRENVSFVGSGINAHDLGQIAVSESRFVDNGIPSSGGGGGIAAFDCDLTVTGCVFTGNESGGGAGMAVGFGTMALADSAFVGNISSFIGGAVDEANNETRVVNCLFSSNEASLGGGFFTSTPDITFVNCTFVDNTTSGLCEDTPGNPVLHNCIFRGNAPEQITIDPPGATPEATAFYSDVQGGFAGPGSNNIDADPQFVGGPAGQWTGTGVYDPATGESTFTDADAAFTPGTLVGKLLEPTTLTNAERPIVANTATTITVLGDVAVWGVPGLDYQVNDYRLTGGSPCIDAADNTAVPLGVTTDLDGLPRFLEIPETVDTGNGTPPIVDMGAYEALGDGCLAITDLETICHGDGIYFTVNVEGLNACTGGTTQATFTGAGGDVGADFCATLIINTEHGGFCCSTQVCVPVPDCAPSPPPCDVDGDFAIGVTDFLALLSAWGPNPGHPADLDGDGSVGVADFLGLLSMWGPCP